MIGRGKDWFRQQEKVGKLRDLEAVAREGWKSAARRGLQYLSYNTPSMMSQDYLASSPASSWLGPCRTSLEQLSPSPCLSRDCESSSSTTDPDCSLQMLTEEPPIRNYLCRDTNQIRRRYLQRLEEDGLLPERPRKKCHHLIIFDWDDTLLPTTFLNCNRYQHPSQVPPEAAAKIRELDGRVARLVSTALELANVVIVTSSVQGWVQFTARSFLPQTYRVIEAYKVVIVSARARYEDVFPGDPQKWKTESFRDLLMSVDRRNLLNLVSVGDSKFQMEAAEEGSIVFERRCVKTVKLRERPRVEELIKQVGLVETKLREIVAQPKALTIRLEKK